jgi:hypothetical protein
VINFTHVPVLVIDVADPRDPSSPLPGLLGTDLFGDRDLILNTNIDTTGQNYLGIGPQWMWKTNGSGSWSNAANWQVALPGGVDTQANFFGAITSPATITVDGSGFTVGSIAFDNLNRYTINGPGTITLEVSGDNAQINVSTGSHTINAPMTLHNDTDVTIWQADSTLTVTSDVTATGVAINKFGPGTLEMKNVRAGSLLVDSGKVLITPNGTAAGASKIGLLSFGTATPINGKLDLTNNALAIDYNGTSPATDVRGWLQSGYASGAWTGNGITSSPAATIAANPSNTHKTAIGFAEASAIGNPSTWFGQGVDGTSIVMRYTFTGDANLDGSVNSGDFTRLAQNFNGAGKFWWQGDFNFDGTVNALDFNALATNFGQVMTSEALGALVPEPAMIAVFVLPALLLRRRRDAAPRLA